MANKLTSVTKLNFANTAAAVYDIIKQGEVPLVHGSPGIGKSALGKVVAKLLNKQLIDIRLTNYEPVDIGGYPKDVDGVIKLLPIELFPTANRKDAQGVEIPNTATPLQINPETGKPFEGFLILCDELTNVGREMQGALYQLFLDRQVGNSELHPKADIMSAGNYVEDGACAGEMSTALGSRLVHLHMQPSVKEVMKHYVSIGIDESVIGYLTFKEEHINTFRGDDKTDFTFACQRTWEKLSNIVKAWGQQTPPYAYAVIEGTVGKEVAASYLAYRDLRSGLPSFEEILANPTSINIPKDRADICVSLATLVSGRMDDKNANTLMKFISRLPDSFAVMSLAMAVQRDQKVLDSDDLVNYISEKADKWHNYSNVKA